MATAARKRRTSMMCGLVVEVELLQALAGREPDDKPGIMTVDKRRSTVRFRQAAQV
jgi:hypothetical protein